MKHTRILVFVIGLLCCSLAGCGAGGEDTPAGTQICLSDTQITVDGQPVSNDATQAVYMARDIVYYEDGHDFTYGEGTQADAHSAQEAQAHRVIHITQPGRYVLSGTLTQGQIAVDLGEAAPEDPEAVVTLVLNDAHIQCTVAPGVIFYRVYECGTRDPEAAAAQVDTSAAGANVILADGTHNTVEGAYVARIYDPDSVELSEDAPEVTDAKKLHKYDGAFYSKMSMNIDGGSRGDGVLEIRGTNEGLDSELHLTINGGDIRIESGNDGINTNEDDISVTTINGGRVDILVNGSTGEGDGIDSNGFLVINGGSVRAQACAHSGDAGLDAELGVYIHGGEVFAGGNMPDRGNDGEQTYAVFQFAEKQSAGTYTLKDESGAAVAEHTITNAFSYLLISNEALSAGSYTLWREDTQLQGFPMENNGERLRPAEGMTPPEGMQPMEGMERPEGTPPAEGMTPPEEMAPMDGSEKPQPPQDDREMEGQDFGFAGRTGEVSQEFICADGGNYFCIV